MGSIGNKQVVTLQQYGRDTTTYKTLYPLPTDLNDANEIARFNFRLGDYADIPSLTKNDTTVKTVKLDTLSNTQETVRKSTIDALLKLGLEKVQGLKDNTTMMGLPFVIHYGNTNMIMDGHHRLTAMRALGAKEAKVRYLDLGQFKKGLK